MNRRNALKNLGLFTGGMLLFPSCDFSDEKVSIVLNKLNITGIQEALLKSVVDTIIPEGDTPGGIIAKCHNFIWTYIDECTSEKEQKDFITGLDAFSEKSSKELGKKFSVNDHEARLHVIKLCTEKGANETIKSFLQYTKNLSVWCYMNSEYFMTQEMPYKLVPGAGSYKTCKTIDPNQKINING